MENIFSASAIHHITEANINFYATPFVHPKRKMAEHDFIYMLDGEWKIGQNNDIFTLKKDSLLILSANNTHYGVAPCQAGTKTMYFHASCEIGDALKDNTENSIVLNSLIDTFKNKTIKKYFSNIVNHKLSGNQRKADLYFELLLCELKENDFNKSDAELAEKIKNLIHSAPEKFFSNEELAKKANVSVKTAENKFKEKYGITIHQYMLNFKIKEAKSYFDMFPDISIKEAAFNLGFYDEYHFSKQFKKVTGISPSVYKRNN